VYRCNSLQCLEISKQNFTDIAYLGIICAHYSIITILLAHSVLTRAVRRRAAAADHMSASRRRRFRGALTSCRTPAIMLLDFCNAVYNEA